MHTNLLDAFDEQVQSRADSVALITWENDQVCSRSWRELASLVQTTAAYLDDLFASSPSLPRRIGYLSGNTVDDVLLTLAAARIGAIHVPISRRTNPAHHQACWDRVGGHWIDEEAFVAVRYVNVADNAFFADREAIDPKSAALILWTSGTSGTAKGVTLSHETLVKNAYAKLKAVPQSPADVRLTSLPLAHAYARTCDFGTWLLSGCTLVLTYGYAGWKQMATHVQPTLANVVPSLANRLLDEEPNSFGLSALKILGCGGAGLTRETFDRWAERGVTVIQGYGCTETGPVICSATPAEPIAGLVGRPVEGWEIDIRDGRLFVRGDHVMLGYWNDPEATAQRIDRNGWFDTGDVVEVDPQSQQFRVLGRSDDVIVLPNGHKIFPASVEQRVNRVVGVRHSMLVYRDHSLQLWLDLHQDADRCEIDDSVRQLLAEEASWQVPDQLLYFSPSLSAIRDELTAKGTICRSRILENRFSAIE
ncbi:class I adenylate-forming enzyme family protein [Novipirellula caenicola]|uniref:2-succinylbenzoate--CoA ligase n=1 Tax=Novipirellula caenicola TaxID=1536901 RepID=A0ABP9W3P9_9BACT